MDEISSNKALTAIIGTLGILWTASGLFSTIRDVLNKIYKINLEVFYVWGKLKDIGMVFIVIVLFLLSFTSFTEGVINFAHATGSSGSSFNCIIRTRC
jgi:uncharacterized BrkB/YihY/UPF0761 family membrane protein